jgi:molecular chaperone GrpE
VLDNFQLALNAHEQQPAHAGDPAGKALVEGLQMVRALLQGALERHGLREIAAIGAAFDPGQHEAVGLAPAGQHPPGTVVEVLQRGYALGDKVLRASKVLVAPESRGQRNDAAAAAEDS